MNSLAATAIAHPNIAFIKYWGNQDDILHIPLNGSLSMNLAALTTTTSVEFRTDLRQDDVVIDGRSASPAALQRVSAFLDLIRIYMPEKNVKAIVISQNNFPMGAGIASSASAFAALAAAASRAAGLELEETALSRLARHGSGSACRSIPDGFVEWLPGRDDEDSYAVSIAAPTHWQLVDLIAVVNRTHKSVGSSTGHALAASSPIQLARVADCARRLEICRKAILERDFTTFADIVEQDSNLMHAVMMSSSPRLLYWEPATLAIMSKVQTWRAEGLQACYTIDAGPNVHVLCPQELADEVQAQLQTMEEIKILFRSPAGEGTHLV